MHQCDLARMQVCTASANKCVTEHLAMMQKGTNLLLPDIMVILPSITKAAADESVTSQPGLVNQEATAR